VAEATRRYEEALRLEPRAAGAANNHAWIYAERNENLSSALRLAQAARAALPGRAEVSDTLGFVYLRSGQPDLAIGPFREAVLAEPANPEYRYRLGQAYARTGQHDAARREIEQALKSSGFRSGEEARRLLQSLPS
jgi:Flp pilus assembly protein TadD